VLITTPRALSFATAVRLACTAQRVQGWMQKPPGGLAGTGSRAVKNRKHWLARAMGPQAESAITGG